MFTQQEIPFMRYRYDALNRLVAQSQLGGLERQRFYCDNRLVTEIQDTERHSIIQHGDQLLALHQQQAGKVKSSLLSMDMQRSVFLALNANDKLVIAYAPYGHRCCEDRSISLLGFNGQRRETMTGHYLLGNGYRAFNPVLMRFNSADDEGPFGKGGLNVYAYCFGDPINRSDASGHVPAMLLKSAVREVSALLGYGVKPIENLKSLTAGIGAFDDSYKAGSRITLMGHGNGTPGEYLLAAGGGRFMDASGLIGLAKKNRINFENYDSVRLLICHSAEPGINGLGSFAQQVSDIVGLPVKAFVGEVGGKATRVPFVGRGESNNHIDYFGVFKKPATLRQFGGRDAYHPVKFQPRKVDEVTRVRSGISG